MPRITRCVDVHGNKEKTRTTKIETCEIAKKYIGVHPPPRFRARKACIKRCERRLPIIPKSGTPRRSSSCKRTVDIFFAKLKKRVVLVFFLRQMSLVALTTSTFFSSSTCKKNFPIIILRKKERIFTACNLSQASFYTAVNHGYVGRNRTTPFGWKRKKKRSCSVSNFLTVFRIGSHTFEVPTTKISFSYIIGY